MLRCPWKEQRSDWLWRMGAAAVVRPLLQTRPASLIACIRRDAEKLPISQVSRTFVPESKTQRSSGKTILCKVLLWKCFFTGHFNFYSLLWKILWLILIWPITKRSARYCTSFIRANAKNKQSILRFVALQHAAYLCFSSRPVALNLSWFVALFQRLSILVAPCPSIGFCNITAEVVSEGLYSWPPENPCVAPKGGRVPQLRNPDLDTSSARYFS